MNLLLLIYRKFLVIENKYRYLTPIDVANL